MGKLLGYGSIDCTKIPKQKMKNNKEGKPAYIDVVMWENDTVDQYGNLYSITLSQTKEEREAGNKSIYIGNLKPKDKPTEPAAQSANEAKGYGNQTANDDLPF